MNKKETFVLLTIFIFYLGIGSVVFIYLENGYPEIQEPVLRDIQGEAAEFWSQNMRDDLSLEELKTFTQHFSQICTSSPISNVTAIIGRMWNFYDGFFFSLTVITTIGYGHLAPISPGGQIFCMFYAIFGVPMTGILIASFGNIFSAILLKAHERSKSKTFHSTRALVVNSIFYLIPGMILFLFLPAIAFDYLEEDWDYLESFYYAFITLTTIGFGDFVAGSEDAHSSMENRWLYQIGIMTWIIFGLGYLAMMFNFISKAMKSKHMQRINRTVGKGFRQTHRLISKEMEEFMRTMNNASHKIGMHHSKRSRKLKRTQSMPLLHQSFPLEMPGRSLSDSELLKSKPKHDFNRLQYEANANTMGFIFQLAKALAYGDLGDDHETGSTCSRHSCRSSLLEILTETIRQASRRSSAWDGSMTPQMGSLFSLGRQNINRRSCDLLTPSNKFAAVLDIPSEVRQPRRKSDIGYYLDVPRVPRQFSIPKLEEINETEPSKSSTSVEKIAASRSTASGPEDDKLLVEIDGTDTTMPPMTTNRTLLMPNGIAVQVEVATPSATDTNTWL